MGLMWLCVGILAGISAWILHGLNKKFVIDWKAWTGLISGIFLILFGIAWSVSSVLEGVPRSGSMGFLLFDGLGLIILVVTWRFNLQLKKKIRIEGSKQQVVTNQENPEIEIGLEIDPGSASQVGLKVRRSPQGELLQAREDGLDPVAAAADLG